MDALAGAWDHRPSPIAPRGGATGVITNESISQTEKREADNDRHLGSRPRGATGSPSCSGSRQQRLGERSVPPCQDGSADETAGPAAASNAGSGFRPGYRRVRHRRTVELSIHPSGFVQFSAAGPTRIISGTQRPFDIPKGLGLESHPITIPVDTGPTFSTQGSP